MNRFLRFGITSLVLGSLATTASAGTANSTGKLREGASVQPGGSKSVVPEGYRIKFTRPADVGQRLHIQGRAVQERTVTAVSGRNEQPIESSRLDVNFNAVARVLAIDQAGFPTAVEYTMIGGSFSSNGRSVDLPSRGTVIMADRRDGGTEFRIDVGSLEPQVVQALQLVAGLHQNNSTDDQILGSASPRRVGERWSINSDQAARRLSQQWNAPVDESNVKGSSSVVSEKSFQGQPCLVVRSELTATGVLPGVGSFPGNVEVRKSFITASYEGTLPTNQTLPSLQDHVRMNMFAEVDAPERPDATLRINGRREAWRTTSILRPERSMASAPIR